MKQIQYVGPQSRVLVPRPGMNRLHVDAHTPLPVPESDAEQRTLQAAGEKRFIPVKFARRMVEHGGGVWVWVLPDGDTAPKAILSGPLPDGFPSAQALRLAGFGLLELVPRTESALMAVPGLVEPSEPGKRVPKTLLRKAANKILDALDALIRGGK